MKKNLLGLTIDNKSKKKYSTQMNTYTHFSNYRIG